MKSIRHFLNKFFPRRIWHQIFFVLFFLVVIPLMILGLLLMNTSQRAIQTTVLRDYEEVALHATGEVKEHIRGAQQTLLLASSVLGTLHADPWRQETVIIEMGLRNPAFERIASVDLSGREIATSELGALLLDRSKEESFLAARKNQSYISEVNVSADYVPYMTIAEPIVRLGKVTGVLIAKVNLRSIWNIVDGIKFGQTGHAYLIDQKGRIIAHPDKKLVLKNVNIGDSNVVMNVLAGSSGNAHDVYKNGKKWLVSYAPIKHLNWGMIITQPEHEAYAFIQKMHSQSWFLIVISILATLVISWFLSKLMSRPVNTLIEATQNISDKDFDYHLRVTRRDEFGKLFHSFNKMIGRMREAHRMEKLSTIGRAATAIAHELKNSLVSVNTYIQLLPERHTDEDFIRDFSKTVPQELASWREMLQNMTDYSKFMQFSKEDVDMNTLIEDVTTLAHHRAKQKDIDLKMNMNNKLPCVSGNEAKLKQVFLNLVYNALEATPSGGKITVSTELIEPAELPRMPKVRIIVEDSGEGLSKDQLEHLFDPFYTTKSEGLGLGLSISKEIVKLHGGRIDAKSAGKQGACFAVEIPAKV